MSRCVTYKEENILRQVSSENVP